MDGLDWFFQEDRPFAIARLVFSIIAASGSLFLTWYFFTRVKGVRKNTSLAFAALLLYVVNASALQFLFSSITEFISELRDWAVITSYATRIVFAGMIVLTIILVLRWNRDEEA